MKRFLLLLLPCVFSAGTLAGQAILSIQGSIQNSSGVSLPDGNYPLTFRLYESESGGTAVWSETQPLVSVSGGLYSTSLGLTTPLTAAFNKPYFLGVSVRESPEITPRARLSAAPYGLSLVGQHNLLPSTGSVGIGTISPDSASELHLQKNAGTARLLVEGRDTARIVFKTDSSAASISYDGDKIYITNVRLIADEGINLAVGKSIAYDGDADWRLVEIDDFETDAEGWISTPCYHCVTSVPFERRSPNTAFSKGYLLRPTHGGSSTLKKEFDLTGIPHSKVKVVFTYHFYDSWDYRYGLEYEFGFAAFATQNNPQASTSNGNFQVGWRSIPQVCRRGSMVAETSESKFWVVFGSNLNESAANESFGISNVEVWVK
jgi:hypothetical protein